MHFKDKSYWDTCVEANQDAYGSAIWKFAERWANLMEEKLVDPNLKVADIADKTMREVDEGITGFMYGIAVSLLANSWEHGEELREWHNSEYSAEYKGDGIVNPAVVTYET